MPDKFSEAGDEPYVDPPDSCKFEAERDSRHDEHMADDDFMVDLNDDAIRDKYSNSFRGYNQRRQREESPKFLSNKEDSEFNNPAQPLIVKPREGMGRYYAEEMIDSEMLGKIEFVMHDYQESAVRFAELTTRFSRGLHRLLVPKNKFGEPDG